MWRTNVYLLSADAAPLDGEGAATDARPAKHAAPRSATTTPGQMPPMAFLLLPGAPGPGTLSLIAELRARWPDLPMLVIAHPSLPRTLEALAGVFAAGGDAIDGRPSTATTLPRSAPAIPIASREATEPSGQPPGHASDLPLLSRREREVLSRRLRGETVKTICADLGLARTTVQTYLDHARAKLDAENVTQLGRNAERRGLLRGGV